MPQLSRFLIRSGMVCLLLGLFAGAAATLSPAMAAIRPTWVHLITVGWLTQLIFGVALWMFPRPRSDVINPERWGWVGFWSLNAGLLLRVIGEPIWIASGRGRLLLAGSAILQFGAVLTLVMALWPRVRQR